MYQKYHGIVASFRSFSLTWRALTWRHNTMSSVDTLSVRQNRYARLSRQLMGAEGAGAISSSVVAPASPSLNRDQVLLVRHLIRNPSGAFNSYAFGGCDAVELSVPQVEQVIASGSFDEVQLASMRARCRDRVELLATTPPTDEERTPEYVKHLLHMFCSGALGGRDMLLFRVLATFEDPQFLHSIITDRASALQRLQQLPPGAWLIRTSSFRDSADGSIRVVAISCNSNLIAQQCNLLIAHIAGLGFVACVPTNDNETLVFRSQGMPVPGEQRYVTFITPVFGNFADLLTHMSVAFGFALDRLVSA